MPCRRCARQFGHCGCQLQTLQGLERRMGRFGDRALAAAIKLARNVWSVREVTSLAVPCRIDRRPARTSIWPDAKPWISSRPCVAPMRIILTWVKRSSKKSHLLARMEYAPDNYSRSKWSSFNGAPIDGPRAIAAGHASGKPTENSVLTTDS